MSLQWGDGMRNVLGAFGLEPHRVCTLHFRMCIFFLIELQLAISTFIIVQDQYLKCDDQSRPMSQINRDIQKGWWNMPRLGNCYGIEILHTLASQTLPNRFKSHNQSWEDCGSFLISAHTSCICLRCFDIMVEVATIYPLHNALLRFGHSILDVFIYIILPHYTYQGGKIPNNYHWVKHEKQGFQTLSW